jgi:beta-glucosidase-like glycosyl hydrolase
MQEGGCDCGPGCTLTEEVLNARVKDVLRVKARLGLIKNPKATFVQERPVPASDTHAPDAWVDHNELASRLAHESTVLLQNKVVGSNGAADLPAEPSAVASVAVIGPNADAPRYGDYTGAEHHRGGNINMLNAVPLLEAIKKVYSEFKPLAPQSILLRS